MGKEQTSGRDYEGAFRQCLELAGIDYIQIDQAQKSRFKGQSVKSFDFLVRPGGKQHLLVDVKGRKLSVEQYRNGRLGESWVTREDVTGLGQWESVFGNNTCLGVFVFAYWLYDWNGKGDFYEGVVLNGRRYVFRAIDLSAYVSGMHNRSTKWNTVFVPARLFRMLVEPFPGILKRGLRQVLK